MPDQLRIEVGGPDPDGLSDAARLTLRALQIQIYTLMQIDPVVHQELFEHDLIELRTYGPITIAVLTNRGRGYPTGKALDAP